MPEAFTTIVSPLPKCFFQVSIIFKNEYWTLCFFLKLQIKRKFCNHENIYLFINYPYKEFWHVWWYDDWSIIFFVRTIVFVEYRWYISQFKVTRVNSLLNTVIYYNYYFFYIDADTFLKNFGWNITIFSCLLGGEVQYFIFSDLWKNLMYF